MGDAVTGSVAALLAVPGLGMTAPYVTGKGIAWTPAELAAASFLPMATIDQGGQGSPVLTATVRDVEQFAWTVPAAVDRTGWTAARPTIYCNRNTLPAVLAAGWQGDLWLAIPGWQPGQPLPATPGCTVVAVQNNYDNPAYDLSIVLDPVWPALDPPPEETMLSVAQLTTTAMIAAPVGADGQVYVTMQSAAGGPWTKTGPIGGPVPLPGKVDAVIEVAGDVPYVFIHSADPVAAGDGDVYLSALSAGTWSAWTKIT